ncbi:MAG: hypothetical protein GC154_15200 [bacterium]|nr:hypothetical protein [bacterium]
MMKIQRKTRSYTIPLLIALMVSGFALTAARSASADDSAPSKIMSSVTVKSATSEITGDEWRSLSYSAGLILKHVDQARIAIAQKNKDDALVHVNQGLTLVHIINNVLPPVVVETQIKAGDAVYHDRDQYNPFLVPIYNESIRYDILAPVMRAQNIETPQLLKAGVDYSTENLNVQTAGDDLNAAQRLLQNNDLIGADAVLNDLFNRSVMFETVQYELPISGVVRQLAISERQFNNGNYIAAEKALRQASDLLSDTIKNIKTEDRVLMERMRQNIVDLADVVHDQARRPSFTSHFTSIWNNLTSFMRTKHS